MQGINKARHRNLLNVMQQLEQLSAADSIDAKQLAAYRFELEEMLMDYEQRLNELSVHIDAYHTLLNYLKTQYIGKKLRELKKQTPVQGPEFPQLLEQIQLVYSS